MEPQATAAAAFFGMVKAGYSAGIQLPSRASRFDGSSHSVMPGLVPGIHVFLKVDIPRRGWPGRSPAMTNARFSLK